jgi:hypothetical protein
MEKNVIIGKIEVYQEVTAFLLSEDKELWAANFSLKQLELVEKLKEMPIEINLESTYKALICDLSFDKSVEEISSPINNLNSIDIYSDSSETEYTEEFQVIYDKNYDYFDNKFREYNLIK